AASFRLPRPNRRRTCVTSDGNGDSRDWIDLVDEKRVIMLDAPVPRGEAANENHVAGAKELGVLLEISKEQLLVSLLNPLFLCEFQHLEQVVLAPGEVQELLGSTQEIAAGVLLEIDPSNHSRWGLALPRPPSSAGALERIE